MEKLDQQQQVDCAHMLFQTTVIQSSIESCRSKSYDHSFQRFNDTVIKQTVPSNNKLGR